MQKFFGLKVTGRPDAETLHVMQQGWCGGPDVAPYVLTEGNPRWEHTDLTYRIENYTPDLPRAEVDRAIEKAFQLWSDVSPLTFTKVSEGQADIMLSFGEIMAVSPTLAESEARLLMCSRQEGAWEEVFILMRKKHGPMTSECFLYKNAFSQVGQLCDQP
ncbi:interstitial collagenase-like [Felis catus]|uniref:interstitial collagenase-like n=1 Tax=Felis catus TaxID=9685 RepID=UPI001D199EF2|nr:interstitial collagenase-like [Felis catus]